MVQTSVDNCNNVNLDPEMCLRRGEDVLLQTRVAQKIWHNLKSRVRGPDPQFPHWIRACNSSQRVWKENGISSFINLYFAFKNIISYKQCIEHNNKIYD